MQKPVCSLEQATKLVTELFGVTDITDLKELESYDDRNFYLRARLPPSQQQQQQQQHECPSTPPFTPASAAEFVLKVHNGTDSRADRESFLDAQNQVMLHLISAGIATTEPVASVNGRLMEFAELPLKKQQQQQQQQQQQGEDDGIIGRHGVRLLRYVPGRLMCHVPHTPALLTDLGDFLGRVSGALSDFAHPATHRAHLWDLSNLPALEAFLGSIEDMERRTLAESVLARFSKQVVPLLDQLPRAVCQNDANDHNLVVDNATGERIAGLLDFGDMCHTARVFELGICVAYALLDKQDLTAVASNIIRGYTRACPLLKKEACLLHTLAAARLAQSAIMSAYSYAQDPGNEYLLVTALPGWTALKTLMEMDKQAIERFNDAAAITATA